MNAKHVLLSLVVLLTACSSDNDEFNATNVPKAQLTISTEIVTTRSRLKSDVEFANDNRIGVWLIERKPNQHGSSYDNAIMHNRKAVFNNNTWIFDSIPILNKKNTKVYAYYPFTAKYDTIEWITQPTNSYWITGKEYNVPINIHDDGHNFQQDYLWGEADSVNCDNSHANINFKHVLPRITFNIKKSSDNINDIVYIKWAILANAVKGTAIYTKGYMNILTGKVYKGNSTSGRFYQMFRSLPDVNDSIKQFIFRQIDSQETQELNYLVLPTEFKDGEVVLRLEVRRGTSDNYELYEIPIPATKWESGKQYTYPVTISIKGNQQGPKETLGEKVYLGFNGDNGKPLYWSSWNLGATKVEDYGGLYGWGDPTGNHKEHYYDNSLYRDQYYMQDSVTCLSYYGGFKPKYTNISGTELDVARAKWKSQWRIPTSNEFSKLMSNCTYEWTTYNQVLGFKFVSKINGNSIFLPYAPNRIGSKEEYSEWNTVSGTYNQSTVYWTANVNEKEPFRSTVFYFGNSGYCWNARGAKRYEGLPIRPVTE